MTSSDDDAVRARLVGNTNIGERIIEWRKHRGMMSSSALARALFGEKLDNRGYMVGKNRDSVWRWETGSGKPNRKNVMLLAEVLQVTPADIDPAFSAPRAAGPAPGRATISQEERGNGLVIRIEIGFG